MKLERKRWMTEFWSLRLGEQDKQMLEQVAEANRMSASEWVRNAIRREHAQVVTDKPAVG
jgi:uncharacterized protein (DUF1778 family)